MKMIAYMLDIFLCETNRNKSHGDQLNKIENVCSARRIY